MYKRIDQLKTDTKYNNMGLEKMFKTNLADFDASDPRIRLFSLIQLKPGEEVEYHKHIGESETFFFLSGRGIYNDKTGEGRLDGQSYMGKAPAGVAQCAKRYNKPVIAFSGCVTDDAVICNDYGIDAFFPIMRKVCTLEEAMNTDNAYANLKDTAYQVFRLINTII